MPAVVRPLPDQLPRASAIRAVCAMANAIASATLNRATTAGGVAIGTTPSKVSSTATINYTVGGAPATKAATADLWTPAGATVGFNMWQKYLLMLDSAGAASVQEGIPSNVSAALVAFPGDNFGWSAIVNAANATPGKTIVGSITVKTDGTHTFIPGTTALNATGITTTFQDGIDPNVIPLVGDQQLRPIVLL